MLAGKYWSVAEHLCQNASHTPDVYGLGVTLGVKHDLRSPVPPGGHVLREKACVVVVRVGHSRQAKVTDLLTCISFYTGTKCV